MKKPDNHIGLFGWISSSLRFETHQGFGQIFQSCLLLIRFKAKVLVPTCFAKYQSILQASAPIQFSYPIAFGITCCDNIRKQFSKFLTGIELFDAFNNVIQFYIPFCTEHHHQTQARKTIGVSGMRCGRDKKTRLQKCIHFNNLSSCEQREPANLSGSRLPARGAV